MSDLTRSRRKGLSTSRLVRSGKIMAVSLAAMRPATPRPRGIRRFSTTASRSPSDETGIRCAASSVRSRIVAVSAPRVDRTRASSTRIRLSAEISRNGASVMRCACSSDCARRSASVRAPCSRANNALRAVSTLRRVAASHAMTRATALKIGSPTSSSFTRNETVYGGGTKR